VHKVAYFLPGLLPSFVAEESSLKEYGIEPGQSVWTDDEIAAIRAALKRLTAIRILNANDAEDLIQETLLTMINKQPNKVLEKGPLVWSLGILRKKVGNYYRRVQRYAPLSEGQKHTPKLWITITPEARFLHDELKTIVEEVLSQLPDSQRQAMELMVAGFNAGEIARELHTERYQNVINRLYRGRKRLVKELAKYGYQPGSASSLRNMKRCRDRKPKQTSGDAHPVENSEA
jgi:RNA polymerase sigma factor (sigma-70 family)